MRNVLRHENGPAASAGSQSFGSEGRSAQRNVPLIRAAKLICPQGEFMCVVRDASQSAVRVRLFHQLPDCGMIMLELQNGERHQLELVWQDEGRAALKFVHEAEIARIVECPSRFSKRPIRVNLEVPAALSGGLQRASAIVRGISQQGAKVSCSERFSIGQRIKLEAKGLPNRHARIRWRRNGHLGLVFHETFQFGELARIVHELQQRNAMGGPAGPVLTAL